MITLILLNIFSVIKCDLVYDINHAKLGWEAKSAILNNIDFRIDVLPEIQPQPFSKLPADKYNQTLKLPDQYDWRNWTVKCRGNIVNGGSCANAWALAPAKVMSYRSCEKIQNIQQSYSSFRILSCCQSCGAGCFGGYPWRAFNYLKNVGVPTEQCQPMLSINTSLPIRILTPFCRLKNCVNNVNYTELKVKNIYTVGDIKIEIYQRGPVLSYMTLYKDFLYYKSGIYKHKFGQKIGRLSVILLGWGVEDGTQFWIGENTWGSVWGEKGYFRIVRGKNHANIEQYVIAGVPGN